MAVRAAFDSCDVNGSGVAAASAMDVALQVLAIGPAHPISLRLRALASQNGSLRPLPPPRPVPPPRSSSLKRCFVHTCGSAARRRALLWEDAGAARASRRNTVNNPLAVLGGVGGGGGDGGMHNRMSGGGGGAPASRGVLDGSGDDAYVTWADFVSTLGDTALWDGFDPASLANLHGDDELR